MTFSRINCGLHQISGGIELAFSEGGFLETCLAETPCSVVGLNVPLLHACTKMHRNINLIFPGKGTGLVFNPLLLPHHI